MSIAFLLMWMWAQAGQPPSPLGVCKPLFWNMASYEDEAGNMTAQSITYIAEPQDVPAVQERYSNMEDCNQDCDVNERGELENCKLNNHLMYCPNSIKVWRTRLSCADKSRVLLTAEDGKHWCHKVVTK